MFVPTVVHAKEVSNQHIPFTTVHCRTRAALSHTILELRHRLYIWILLPEPSGCLWKLLFLPLLPLSLPALKQINAGFNRGTLLVCGCLGAMLQGAQCPQAPQYPWILITTPQERNRPMSPKAP